MRHSLPIATFAVVLAGNLLAQELKDDLPEVVQRVRPSAVTILVSDNRGNDIPIGSGVFVSSDGEVATNFHIIQNRDPQYLKVSTFHGGIHEALAVLATDQANDLAILKVRAKEVNSAKLSNPDSIRAGETIFIIGTPVGLPFESTVTKGIVSNFLEEGDRRVLQFDAAVSPGSSGSPIFNTRGEVVGLARSTIPFTPGGRLAQNVNFGVPVKYLHELLKTRARSEPYSKLVSRRLQTWYQILDLLEEEIQVTYEYQEPLQDIPLRTLLGGVVFSYFSVLKSELNELTSKKGKDKWEKLQGALQGKDFKRLKTMLAEFYSENLPDRLQFFILCVSLVASKERPDQAELVKLRDLFRKGFVPSFLGFTDWLAFWRLGLREEMKDQLVRHDRLNKLWHPQVIIAQHEFESGLRDSAMSRLERYVASHEAGKVLELLGWIYWRKQQYRKAHDIYRKLVANEPTVWTHHKNLAVCFYKLGKPELAIEELHVAFNVTGEMHFLAALIYLKSGLPDFADKRLWMVIDYRDQNKVALARGTAQVLLGRTELALKTYQNLQKTNPEFAKLLFDLIYE